MVVLMVERAPVGLRGELTRWMIEPRAGVFVGKMSAMVRDKLWERACKSCKDGAVTLVFSSQTEQGFTVRTHGEASRALVEWEGLFLVRVPRREKEEKEQKKEESEATPVN